MRTRLMRGLLACFLLFTLGAGTFARAETPLRIGLTPAILHDRQAPMGELRAYFAARTGRQVELVLRDSYRQIIDLLTQDQLDYAWVSAYPFVYLQQHARLPLLATPLYQGRPFFRAYLIVPVDDQRSQNLFDLKGKLFAFTDPYSHTGYLVPRYELKQKGLEPQTFFAKTFFTGGHKKAVQAVASGLADGGYVDSFVWDTLNAIEPELTGSTRIVTTSVEYGFPPFVASRKVGKREFLAMQQILIGMADDPQGKQLLKALNIDGFVAGDPKWYGDVARMMRAMGDQ